MILRRFMKHVSDQNWFAVGLDVLVVITGIFLGMQVTDWNEERKDAFRKDAILKSLEAEFFKIAENEKINMDATANIANSLGIILKSVEGGELLAENREAFRYGLQYGYEGQGLMPISNTMKEIIANGQIELLDDKELVSALMDFESWRISQAESVNQIRIAITTYVPAWTRHFQYDPAGPSRASTPEKRFIRSPVVSWNFEAMQKDKAFYDATEELRELQYYFQGWHGTGYDQAMKVLAQLKATQEQLQ